MSQTPPKASIEIMHKISVSIIIPAYNEEKNIQYTVANVVKLIKKITRNFEIIVINDGSHDTTEKIIKNLAKQYKHLKIISYQKNRGLGFAFKKGVVSAIKTYVCGFPGDGDMSFSSLTDLITHANDADIVSSYMVNAYKRSLYRKIISATYVFLLNLLFGLKLKYYNGHFICRAELLKNLPIKSNGFVFFAEVKIKLLKMGASFKEIPFTYAGRKYGKSKSISLKNLIDTVYNTFLLWHYIYFPKL